MVFKSLSWGHHDFSTESMKHNSHCTIYMVSFFVLMILDFSGYCYTNRFLCYSIRFSKKGRIFGTTTVIFFDALRYIFWICNHQNERNFTIRFETLYTVYSYRILRSNQDFGGERYWSRSRCAEASPLR